MTQLHPTNNARTPSRFLPGFFQTLDARLTTLAESGDLTAEVRADLAVKGLRLAALAGFDDVDALRQKIAGTNAIVDTIANAQERDYLRRILLEAAQDALPDAASETSLDELLDSIDDDDERQNALYARFKTLAMALPSAEDYAAVRRSLDERAEELEDLRQYEDVAARIYAADRIVGFSDGDASLETPTGRIAQNDGALVSLLANVSEQIAAPILAQAATDAFAVLDDLEKTLDTRVQGEGAETIALEEDEVEELREEAASLVLRSPTILEYGEKLRGYVERRDAFDAIVEEIALLLRAAPDSALYPRNAAFYEAELNAALDLAETLAKGRASRLVRLAATIFPARPSDVVEARARDFVREALAVMAKATRSGERVEEYAALVGAHVDAGATGPAGRLAKLLAKELDAIDLQPTRIFHKKNAFPLLLKALDREQIEDFVESEDDEEFQRALEFELAAFDAIRKYASDPSAIDAALVDVFSETFDETLYDDPLVAADAILDLNRRVDSLL